MVAEDDGEVVGHILFSPVTLSGFDSMRIAGLGPLAVSPARQRSGIGSQLVQAGLDACRENGFAAAVVVGHPEYYPRFGFRPGSHFGVGCEFDVPDDVFMVIELAVGTLRDRSGTIYYHPAFKSLT